MRVVLHRADLVHHARAGELPGMRRLCEEVRERAEVELMRGHTGDDIVMPCSASIADTPNVACPAIEIDDIEAAVIAHGNAIRERIPLVGSFSVDEAER